MTKNKDLVTVIIFAYNCKDYITEAVNSIINQTYKNLQIIIADDASTDGTKEIIQNFDDPRILKIFNKKNLGKVGNWNNALNYIKGEYVALLDGDDYSLPERIDLQLGAFKKDPDLVLCGSNFSRFLPNGKLLHSSSFPLTYEDIMDDIDNKHRLPILGAGIMIKAEVIKEVGGIRPYFEGVGFEDMDWILRIVEKYKAINLPEPLYVYRYVQNSLSRFDLSYNFRKFYSNEIGFFFYEQRKKYGADDIMTGNFTSINNYLKELENKYNKDKSAVYRRLANNQVNNWDFGNAVKSAIKGIGKNPLEVQNLMIFPKILGKWVLSKIS